MLTALPVSLFVCMMPQCEFTALNTQQARPKGDMVFIFWTSRASEDAAGTAGLLLGKHNTDVQVS